MFSRLLFRFTLHSFLIIFLFGLLLSANAQKKTDDAIAKSVSLYKADTRGAYRDIRWFCKDGTTLPPQERCAEPGGVQRARYRDDVIALGKTNHIYLGQILASTEHSDFWDAAFQQSRLKQYQLEKYLRAIDDGWINRKAQYYRGAYQVEDEEAWGLKFLTWTVSDSNWLNENYFLIRQAAKDIPHAKETNLAQTIRALSKEIADQNPSFMDLRVKIHGQPNRDDLVKVRAYQSRQSEKLSMASTEKIEKLLEAMELYYQPISLADFKEITKALPATSAARKAMEELFLYYEGNMSALNRLDACANASLALRKSIIGLPRAADRLLVIDASNKLETLINKEAAAYVPKTVDNLNSVIILLIKAAAGFGYLENWEYGQLNKQLITTGSEAEISLGELQSILENSRRAVEWSSGLVRTTYRDVSRLYGSFEPLAAGFTDDRVRSSVLLPLGNAVSRLGDYFGGQAGFSNELMGLKNQSSARGLNPGYAKGILVVTTQNPEDIEVESSKIYVFDRPPADLKPVAGIATVSEGNMVSHVQLLARNLGIPNAVLSTGNLNDLKAFSGQGVFYAVSPNGRVILKPETAMTLAEKALFTKKVRSEEKITVPVELMELNDAHVLNLRDVDAGFSGKVCGPKAANLGQLKALFPDQVVEGLVIPFAIFKKHFDQKMDGRDLSYWNYLNETFAVMRKLEADGSPESETYTLARLDTLRAAIKKMPLLPEFESELKQKFKEILGAEMGKKPVFIRSDTNMEDLKDFTGAGLNLTVFNVLETQKIFEGIKDVWASPYMERSYKWRQKYLLNPENVFPSILIIPTVNAECSGVLITKGVGSGRKDEVTVAFSRGVGGAVEGQASETWSLAPKGVTSLLSPSREPDFTTVPAKGGTEKMATKFDERILSPDRLLALRKMAADLERVLPNVGIKGPYDVELGFIGNTISLFQVRPFVENKRAAGSEYLQSISENFDASKKISRKAALQ